MILFSVNLKTTPRRKHRMLPYFHAKHGKLLGMFHLGKRVQVQQPLAANPSDISSHHANMVYNVVDLPSLGPAGGGGTFQSAAQFSTPSAPRSRSLQVPSASGTAVNAFTNPFKSCPAHRCVSGFCRHLKEEFIYIIKIPRNPARC